MIDQLNVCADKIIKTVRAFDTGNATAFEHSNLRTEVGEIILSHQTSDSRSSRLVMVGGIGYVVPNKVADHLREVHAQVKQLQDHCSELTRDVNMARR